MTERQATTIFNKGAWGPGPWQEEPDLLEFEHAGLSCLLIRNQHTGNWLGYVRVPSVEDAEFVRAKSDEFDVHGGVTFTGEGIAPEGWWIGFDCNHGFDFAPGYGQAISRFIAISGATTDEYFGEYRNMAYARDQCESLARQVAAFLETITLNA